MTTVNRMRCRPLTTKATDIAFWLARSEFLRLVHTENYLCREIQHSYTGAYLKDWFTEPVGAELPGLWLPTVHLSKGRIAFINGRHRTSDSNTSTDCRWPWRKRTLRTPCSCK